MLINFQFNLALPLALVFISRVIHCRDISEFKREALIAYAGVNVSIAAAESRFIADIVRHTHSSYIVAVIAIKRFVICEQTFQVTQAIDNWILSKTFFLNLSSVFECNKVNACRLSISHSSPDVSLARSRKKEYAPIINGFNGVV